MEDRDRDRNRTLRHRIEVQGYLGLDGDTLVGLDSWLRLTPFVTCLIAALSTLVEAPAILVALSIITFLGVLLPRHPVDMLYNALIRDLEASPEIPVTPGRRRIVYLIWAAMLAGTAWFFTTGNIKAGFLLGWVNAAIIGILAAQQLCLISEVIERLRGSRTRGET